MANLPTKQLESGVICSSAGNHAQGVALSAKRLGCNAVIVMPLTTPEIKVNLVFALYIKVLISFYVLTVFRPVQWYYNFPLWHRIF